MKTELDISNWNRKEHYNFFIDFEEPFFGICVNVNCDKAYKLAKTNGYSFYLYYLHKSLLAANTIEPFKYRIENDTVYMHDVIHASTTVLRPDNTVGLADIEYNADYPIFEINAKNTLNIIKKGQGFNPGQTKDGTILYSTLPWLNFTAMNHARRYSKKESAPRITFGKVTEIDQQKIMPVSIFVHHALMDGLAVSEYINLFQQFLDE